MRVNFHLELFVRITFPVPRNICPKAINKQKTTPLSLSFNLFLNKQIGSVHHEAFSGAFQLIFYTLLNSQTHHLLLYNVWETYFSISSLLFSFNFSNSRALSTLSFSLSPSVFSFLMLVLSAPSPLFSMSSSDMSSSLERSSLATVLNREGKDYYVIMGFKISVWPRTVLIQQKLMGFEAYVIPGIIKAEVAANTRTIP